MVYSLPLSPTLTEVTRMVFTFCQVKEAEDYLKQANKMLTKTITRWNPDFFSAAPLFEKVCC